MKSDLVLVIETMEQRLALAEGEMVRLKKKVNRLVRRLRASNQISSSSCRRIASFSHENHQPVSSRR